MVAIYVRWIQAGKMVLAQVPEKWRYDVMAELNRQEVCP